MEQTFFNHYLKEFEIETSQIQEWITYLIEIKNQANLLRESTQSETIIYESLGKNMLTAVKAYYNNVNIYSDEPSQLFSITKTYCSIFEFTGKSFTQDVLMLNIHVNKYIANMIEEVDMLIRSIMENSSFDMDELINVKKSYNNIQAKYLKLKADIEEAHLAKKKIEIDPKLIYNISLKDKAEQKILSLLKEMQIVLPDLEIISKEVDNKKTAFNKLMKESFELIVGCVFKNHVRIRETFFLLSKEKEDLFTRVKENANIKFAQIRETNYQLNDFVERKYAEFKNIYYDSIDSIIINEDDYFLANSLINISDTLLNYGENFYNLMKKRKRILKEFHKFFVSFSKGLEQHIVMYHKAIKQIQSAVGNFKDICKGTKRTWDHTLNQLNENYNSYSALTKNLINSSNNYIMKIANEIKSEYVKFLDKWSKFSKQIILMKPQLIKIQTNKSKIISKINELRSSVTNLSNLNNGGGQFVNEKNNAKILSKINQLKEEESSIRENTNITCKKYKDIIIQSIDFLKTTVKPIRENEGKKLKGFSDILENFDKVFKNFLEKNLDLLSCQTEMSVNSDIYEEVKDIFSNYLDRFNITEKFFELIIKKILKSSTFNSDDYAKDKINSYLSQKERGNYSPLNGNLDGPSNNANGEYSNQNYGNFGNNKDCCAAYENVISQNTPSNNAYMNNNPYPKNFSSGNFNFKHYYLNNNFNQSNKNLNQSSINYSGVNLNLNLSRNDELNNSPDQRFRISNLNKNNANEEPISGNRFTLKETKYFADPIENNYNERPNYENSILMSPLRLEIDKEEKISPNAIFGSPIKQNTNNNFTIMKNNGSRSRTASFDNKIINNNYNSYNNDDGSKGPVKLPLSELQDKLLKQRNYTFNTGKEKDDNKPHISNNDGLILDDSDKLDLESFDQKSPDMNFLLQNQLADENRNYENYYNEEDHNNSSSLIETLGSLEEEKMNFINLDNFKVISNNGYDNIKENEIKEYMDKLNANVNSPDEVKVTKVGKNPQAGNFVLERDETLIDKYSCAYSDKILMQGKLYVTSKKIAFRSMFNNKTFFGTTKLLIPIEDIEKVEKKYNLLIFDNSLEIVTKKTRLFFTSFVSRDQCFKVISDLVDDYKKNIKKDDSGENNENDNFNENLNNTNLRKSNLSFGNRVLKKIDFLKRLDNLHKENLDKFEQTNTFKSFDFYKNVYYNNESIGNVSLPLIYNYIYNPDIICEELNCNKNFWESIFLLRKDYDIAFEAGTYQIPKFYSDLDYVMNKLSNFEEENLNEFLDDIPTWGIEPIKFNYKFTHPIKKKMFAPEKVNLSTDFLVYLISPKLFIVEEHGYSSGFTYCDYFVSMSQYRFFCDYKFDSKENCFKFITNISIGFQIHFLKTCMFKNMIETEGAKESEESIRFNIMEKMKQVFESQSNIFNEYFKKMTDENNQRLASSNSINNIRYLEDNDENLNDVELNEEGNNLINDQINNKREVNKESNKLNGNGENDDISQSEKIHLFSFEIEKKLLVALLMYVFLVLFILYNLKTLFIDKEFTFDKFINTMLLVSIFFIFNKMNR